MPLTQVILLSQISSRGTFSEEEEEEEEEEDEEWRAAEATSSVNAVVKASVVIEPMSRKTWKLCPQEALQRMFLRYGRRPENR